MLNVTTIEKGILLAEYPPHALVNLSDVKEEAQTFLSSGEEA
jgi:hypothetical protein